MAISLNDTLQINSPKSIDNKYGIFASGAFRAYTSTAEVNSTILSAYRSKGLTVLVTVGGVNTEYWYRAGITDSDLVVKPSVATVTSPLSLTGGTLSILVANGSQGGYLSASDWTTFNTKLGSISVASSVVGNGTGGTPLQLQGDSSSPGNLKYYGTDGSGTKGFFTLPAGTVTSVFGRNGDIVAATNDYTFAQIGSKPTTLSGYGITDAQSLITAGTTSQYYRGDKTFQTLNATAVGLANVPNVNATERANVTYTANQAALLADGDKVVFLDGTSTTVTYTITPATFIRKTLIIYCKNSANTVTIAAASGTVGGYASIDINADQALNLYSDGTNLYII